MNEFDICNYDFDLPHGYIASKPIADKTQAKLLVYYKKSGTMEHHHFSAFESIVPTSYALVLNDTKVLKARFFGENDKGKCVEILYHKHCDAHHFIVQMRGKVKRGMVFSLEHNFFLVVEHLRDDGLREVVCKRHIDGKPAETIDKETFLHYLQEHGQMPIPPYLKRKAFEDEEELYQNPFAKYSGSIAAPTASLHFSLESFKHLKSRHDIAFVTLHIGAATFKPVRAHNILEHVMHSEDFYIPAKSASLFDSQKPLLAIGSTALRVIEHYARTQQKAGECRLFLNPKNPPLRTQALLTNFHLPKSSLLILVASMVGVAQMQHIYAEALAHHYRFYSYGDAMLVLDE